jgi:hypothetical protein
METLTNCCARIRRPRLALSRLLVATLAGALFLVVTTGSAAQSPPTIVPGAPENNFPDGITFRATVSAGQEITDIRLRYKILPDGTAASARPKFAPGASADVEVMLDDYLPPGTIVNYYWEVRAGSERSETAEQSFFYDDIRFQWQKVEANGLTVYHYTGGDAVAEALLDTGAQAVADAEALLGVEVPFPINVWIYESREDMVPALPPRSPTYEERIITLGVRIASDTVLVLGEVSYDTLRHELAHVVTAVAGDSAFGSMPAWLDEGTAVLLQGDPGGYSDAIESAIKRGNVLSIREVSSPPGEPEKVGLFYGQAWSIVKYLVDEYGESRFAELFAHIKSGELLDDALTAVYGFDQNGLENEWREANGLPAREAPETTVPGEQTHAPQLREGDDGTSTTTLIVLGGAVLLFAAVVAVAVTVLARRLR